MSSSVVRQIKINETPYQMCEKLITVFATTHSVYFLQLAEGSSPLRETESRRRNRIRTVMVWHSRGL